MADGVETYRRSFARRSAAMAEADQTALDQPGICGVLGSAQFPGGRVLITDDRAVPTLEALLPDLLVGILNVFEDASRCRELIEQAGRWSGQEAMAMICPDLHTVPVLAVPAGLTIRTVRRSQTDAADGIPLEEAARACLAAEPDAGSDELPGFVEFLWSLPPTTRLLAAVDDQNVVRATSGSSAFGVEANAYFVSTDEHWRGRGIATAMTASALAWAREAGASQASLDSSQAGLSIYLRLGFQPVSRARLFTRFS
ncbi:MAG TPA: GNAT family N-acetyltransferase [Acidothermaceae bacterium]